MAAILRSSPTTLRLLLSIKPNAKTSAVTSIPDLASSSSDDTPIGVRIAAPPRDGEANTEVVRFVAKTLGVRKSGVRIIKGEKGREKVVEVEDGDMEVEEVVRRLEKELEGGK